MLRKMFCEIMRYLDKQNYIYCVVGRTSDFPHKIVGDVDIVLNLPHKNSAFHKLATTLSDNKSFRIVQHLQHETVAHYYVIYSNCEKNEEHFIKLDLCGDYVRNARVLLSAKEILQGRQKALDKQGNEKGFYIAAPEVEFIYYLVKKIDKLSLSDEQVEHLSTTWRKAPDAARKKIKHFWNEEHVKRIVDAAKSNDWTWVQDNIALLQKNLHKRSPRLSITRWLDEMRRICHRITNPTGIHIVFLGPDGSGKTSVIKRVSNNLEPVFRDKAYYHLFPKQSTGKNAPETDPHRGKPRNYLPSIAKLFLWLYRYWSGYLLNIHPKKIKSTAIYLDRYYHDLLVDPKRYRYGSPMWLARLVGKLVPKPDLWILLDAPPEVLQSRKQEVPFKESARQRQAYLDLIKEFDNSVVINASQPLGDVVTDANKAILELMASRTEKRLAKSIR